MDKDKLNEGQRLYNKLTNLKNQINDLKSWKEQNMSSYAPTNWIFFMKGSNGSLSIRLTNAEASAIYVRRLAELEAEFKATEQLFNQL